MSLEAVFAAFPARLGPDIIFAGPQEVDSESRPPRITWQPVAGAIIPPKRMGGAPGEAWPIYTRQWTISVLVWGADLAEAHQLADLFLAVAHDLLSSHGFRGAEEVWDTGGATAAGVLCRMNVNLFTPVLRSAHATRPITAINGTYTLDDTTV